MDKWLASGADPKKVPTETLNYVKSVMGGKTTQPSTAQPNPDLNTAALGATLESKIPEVRKYAEDYYRKNIPEMKNEGVNAVADEARRTLDPAEQKKRRNEDKWATLAEIGFSIAGSNSPYLLQAVGQAASAALPGARAAKKEREAEKRQAYRDLAEAEGITYKQAMDKANYIRDVAKERYDILDKDIGRAFQHQQTLINESGATYRAKLNESGATARNIFSETHADNRANLAARATMGTEFRQSAKILRDQAEAARDRAMTLNRDFMKETDPEIKAGLADQLLSELANFGAYNKQLKDAGAGGVNIQHGAFRTLDQWAADKSNNYTSPYAKARTQPTAGAPSSAMQAADRILAGH
jgi:hypothetical protein